MVKRRDVIRLLEQNGFRNEGGANHDIFRKDERTTSVPRHREIKDSTFKVIKKQAGIE